MIRALCTVAVLLLVLVESADATTILFNTNPLTGNPALITPGRQIVPPAGSEPFLTFNPATDVIALDPAAFGVGVFGFANGLSTSLPMTGVNFIVLQNGAPLAAGTAADAIANQLTQDAPGFFIETVRTEVVAFATLKWLAHDLPSLPISRSPEAKPDHQPRLL